MAEKQPVQSPSTATPPPCTPLEQEVLDEYALLLNNLNKVHPPLQVFSLRLSLYIPTLSLPPAPHLSLLKTLVTNTGCVSRKEKEDLLSAQLNALADRPTGEVLDGLRMLERKMSLVLTLLKASVYSIVLQQQVYGGEDDA
ncbi:hypothetical protein MMC22_006008 [Lobaria immixta]|nr:hypothetical protein [Lobaria immixta]